MNLKNKEKQLQTGYYLIELIRAELTGTSPAPMPEGVAPESLFEMAKIHNVDCIAYHGAGKIQGERGISSIEAQWKQRSMQCAIQGMVQLAERSNIYQAMSENGIRILPLKGCIMKEMYPKPEYRQMADLDILIDHENAETVKKILESMGYESTGEFGIGHHDEYFKAPWCNLEIHRHMLPKRIQSAKKYKDIWTNAYEEQPGSGIYRLTWDDFYIYMLEHFAKHFYEHGSGIRSIIDIHIFLQNKRNELNQEYLEKELKERKLWEFKEVAEQIAESWFEKGKIGLFPDTETVLIVSGAYGAAGIYHTMHMEMLRKKYHSRKLASLIYTWEMVFLEYDGMCILYPVLKKYPVFLPVCWMHRLFDRIFKKNDRIKEYLKAANKSDK